MIVSLAVALFASSVAVQAGALRPFVAEAARAVDAKDIASVVVSAPLASDETATHPEALALRVATLLAQALGPLARVHPQTAVLSTARGIAGKGRLVYLTSQVVQGRLRTAVDVYAPSNVWDRLRRPLTAPTAHEESSTPVDAEVRAFLTPLDLEATTVARAHHDETEVLAAACGVDERGEATIALVSRTRVTMGHVIGDRFVAERTVPWAQLSTEAPFPMREPIGGAVLSGGAVFVGSTDRGGVELSPDLAVRTRLVGIPAAGGDGVVCLRPEPAAGAFDGAPIDCIGSHGLAPKIALPAPRYDAFAAASVSDADGNARSVVVVREPSGRLKVKMAEMTRALPGPFGAQLAVGDLDEDGIPDVATTGEGPDDAIQILSWAGTSAEPIPRIRLPAPSGVRALAMCPSGNRGEPQLAAVVGDELWLIRAGRTPSPPTAP